MLFNKALISVECVPANIIIVLLNNIVEKANIECGLNLHVVNSSVVCWS